MHLARKILLSAFCLPSAVLWAQSGCASTPAWTACDVAFDLTPAENNAELRAEFKSPKYKTVLIRAFKEGSKLILRFNPNGVGTWTYRLTSNVMKWDGMTGEIQATESSSPGFVLVANVHHFMTEDRKQHLWMAGPLGNFTGITKAEFDQAIDQRVNDKFTHIRLTIDAQTNLSEAAARIAAANAKGLVADLVLASIPATNDRDRERYMTEMVSRFAAYNVTWALGPAFENVPNGRAIMKHAGSLLARLDPYDHPRSALARDTSAPLAADGWMNVRSYGSVDANVSAVEHQFFQSPGLSTGIDTRQDLWNATMNGDYPASGAGPHMKAWAEFMAQSRYWELEPYFDVDGGRALALEGVEYIVYVEKAALVELTLEKHGYDVYWMNPATGEMLKQKEYNGEHFTGEPPDKTHDWVLRVSREGRKEGMLKSYKFDSRRVPVQEIEQSVQRTPFEIGAPESDEISLSKPLPFSLKIKRESRATRSLLVNWTVEVVVDAEGYRIAGIGRQGTLRIPASLVKKFPSVLSMRVQVLNANGKAYALDKVYRLVQ